jgi:hypothetical protein
MSKVFKDFQKRRNSPAGDLIELQRTRVLGNWPNFKYCIQNKLPIYALADTQSGKTFFKFWLADQALNDGIVDNVIISTTNLTGAMTQMFDRAVDWGKSIGRQIKGTTDKNAYMIKGDIFVNMTNVNRTNRIDAIVNDAEKTAKKLNKPVPRILVIMDEGEEFHELTETSQCDTALGNLLIHSQHNISKVSVSATLLSHILIHGKYSSDLGYITKEQIYQIPNHPDYKGITSSNLQNPFIDPVLVAETNFSGDCYTKKANLRNTSNIKITVDQIETLINEQKNIGDDAQTKSLVQIGNVVFGRVRSGHLQVADMFTRAFQNKGRTVSIWDDKDFNQLNHSSNIVIVIHNGHAKDLTVSAKLTAIAHGWDRKNLKAVIIISKMMTGKSITVECDNWYEPSSPEFGFYANFTAYYGPPKENITTGIQAMRCTGIRPAIKKNVMWTTDDTKQDIENYKDQITRFITHLNTVGSITQTQMVEWVMGNRPVTKAAVQKKLGILNGSSNRSASEVIDNNERHISVEADVLFKVSNTIYNKICNDKEAICDFVITKGFAPLSTDPKEWELRQDTTYNTDNTCRHVYKTHTKGNVVKAHWIKRDKGWELYVKNNMVKFPRVEHVVHAIDNTGRPIFKNSRFYTGHDNGVYAYKVG